MTLNQRIGNRIAELMKSQGLKQVDLVDENLKKAHISHIINGHAGISLSALESICSKLNISLAEFFEPFSDKAVIIPSYVQELSAFYNDLTYEDIQTLVTIAKHMKAIRQASTAAPITFDNQAASASNGLESDSVWKPILGDAAAGYDGVYRPADEEDRVLVPSRYAAEEYYVIRAFGPSMEPRISNGGCVVVHKDTPPSNGDLALIRKLGMADHELMIKKYYKEGKNVRLVSANPGFDDIVLPLSAIALCERVVHIVCSEP